MGALHDVHSPVSNQSLVREREMLRYYQPEPSANVPPTQPSAVDSINPANTMTAGQVSSPNTVLTALAQLCAIRLQAQRALISLIGKQKQYFIAEATNTLNLADTAKCEAETDELWIGCGTVGKLGRLCEHTLAAPTERGRFPIFTVSNLGRDRRFNELPFVQGKPYFKFYAGTPLRTKRAISIGSLFILDDTERPHLTENEIDFIGTLAQTIMSHIEAAAEAREKRKIEKLSLGMNAFVEGRSHLVMEHMHDAKGNRWATTEGASTKAAGRATMKSTHSRRDEPSAFPARLPEIDPTPEREDSVSEASHRESDGDVDVDGSMGPTLDSCHRSALSRASNILYGALDIKGHGGVVFFDSTTKRPHMTDMSSKADVSDDVGSETATELSSARVIASTTVDPTTPKSHDPEPQSFVPLGDQMLHSLLRRYPKGNLWNLDGDIITSSDDEPIQTAHEHLRENVRRTTPYSRSKERSLLKQHFPGVKQLLFYGLWDAGSSRWFAACFAWTTSHQPVFTVEIELNYFMTFGNSVMAQVSRLASMAADRQKADFIGSISHELRSPLHGILASAEFLTEASEDMFQHSLIGTISSCGRTLLDTINHILDYSKINSFERTWRNSRSTRGRTKAARNAKSISNNDAPPTLNIVATVDVASLVEEVVEGVYAGQVYQDISSTDATSFSTAGKAEALERGIRFSAQSEKRTMAKDVEIVLDIAYADYVFVTQPGALKRLVMNIFGNALKYTQKGTINISLSLNDAQEPPGDRVIMTEPQHDRVLQLRVTDTGKGITPEYLRTSLYTPFSQEDVLASGTGLGLSIVRSIVTMLHGTIDIQSEVGVGTEVTIWLPLPRMVGPSSTSSTPSSNETLHVHDPIEVLRKEYSGKLVALFGFEPDRNGWPSVLRRYIENWFGLKFAEYSREFTNMSADIFIIEERTLPTLVAKSSPSTPIIAICTNATRNTLAGPVYASRGVEFLSKPCGLHKLAEALRLSFGKAQFSKCDFLSSAGTSSRNEEITPTPQMNNLTLGTDDKDGLVEAQVSGSISAQYSENAQMAMNDPDTKGASGKSQGKSAQGFPFPQQSDGNTARSPPQEAARTPDRPKPTKRASEPRPFTMITSPLAVNVDEASSLMIAQPVSEDMGEAKRELLLYKEILDRTASIIDGKPQTPAEPVKRPPRLLIVDDNKINLRLLETFMKKRKYQSIDMAEDGKLAVEAVEACDGGYDIIFMDISMPVMNGFEATRKIRDLEERRNKEPSALVIALTGLASGDDQAEAFASGVDLFLTKPVSFKEVGKLLDNWEKHRDLGKPEKPPQGVEDS